MTAVEVRITGYYSVPGDTLAVGDYVREHGTWYRLVEIEKTMTLGRTMQRRQVLGVDKTGGRRHILIDDDRMYVAYVAKH